MTTTTVYPDSSMLKRLQYEYPNPQDKGGALEVTFNTGAQYVYHGVPRDVWDELYDAHREGRSVGKAFNRLVKGAYDYEKGAS